MTTPPSSRPRLSARAPVTRSADVRRPAVRGATPRVHRLKTDALSYAMLEAARAVLAVRGGRSLPDALALIFARIPTPQARGAIQDLAYRAMRCRGMADGLIRRLAGDRDFEPPLVRELLVVALALLLSEAKPRRGAAAVAQAATSGLAEAPDTADPVPAAAPYPAFTVVDQAVEAAKATPELARVAGLVNAVLRNYVRDPNVHRAFVVEEDPAAAWNHPAWWIERLRRAWPAQWEALLRHNDQPPPLTLRVNLARTHPDEMLRQFAAAGIAARRIGPAALRLDVPLPVERIPGFAAGLVSVQDEAAQRAAPLLDLDDGMRVLDACAAPGGKTAHILEIADVEVVALDADAQRLTRVRDNLRRLGLADSPRVHLLTGDAARPADWWDGRQFDRILADVPCSASGIVRRHPDIRWLRRDTDIAALVVLQQRILDALWPLLAPGGKLLYVTCSIFPEESARQATEFAERHADALPLAAPGQVLPAVSTAADHDGLFFALFEKRPA